jgi:hypothetical protein
MPSNPRICISVAEFRKGSLRLETTDAVLVGYSKTGDLRSPVSA